MHLARKEENVNRSHDTEQALFQMWRQAVNFFFLKLSTSSWQFQFVSHYNQSLITDRLEPSPNFYVHLVFKLQTTL